MSHYTVGNIHGTLSFYAKELSKKIIKSRNEDEIEYIMVKNINYIIVIGCNQDNYLLKIGRDLSITDHLHRHKITTNYSFSCNFMPMKMIRD